MILYLLGVGNGLFVEEGQGKFSATTRFDCLPKTYRFLTLGGMEGHGGILYLSLFF